MYDESKHIDESSALNQLSEDLSSIFDSELFADAKLIVAGGDKQIPIHRCVVSARSEFFRRKFGGGGETRVEAKELGFESAMAILRYLYGGRVRAWPKGVSECVDEGCSDHSVCRPAIDFLAGKLLASFVFQLSELVHLYQRHLLDIINEITTDDILVILSVASRCGEACERLFKKCKAVIIRSDIDIMALEKVLPQDIVQQITNSRAKLGFDKRLTIPNKHVNRIHSALESDDIELVRMLLKEGHTNLDDACALHHSVAYCDAKTSMELLDLGLADVNCKDHRGRTVLHVAARRREPKIVASLLTKGARLAELNPDGKKALQITKRHTKASEYFSSFEEDRSKASPKGRLCIEILEQAERSDPLLGEASVSLALAGDDLRMKLLYLENRVGLAKLLFPIEAKVIMDITKLDGTFEFLNGTTSKHIGSKRTTMDLNEAPFKIQEEHLIRLKSLSRAVELGKRFFPRCSEVLNKIMDGDKMSQLAIMVQDTPAERDVKKLRYVELQQALNKAFNEDKEEIDRSIMSSSSSSTSMGVVMSPNHNLYIN